MEAYNALCERANQDYAGYWGGLARDLLTWHKPFTQVFDDSNAPFFKWFADGELNVSTTASTVIWRKAPTKSR